MGPRRLLPLLALCAALPAPGATFGRVETLIGGAADIVLDENRDRLYLVNSNASRVDVYSIAQRRYLNAIRTDSRPLAAAMSPNARVLYVTSYDQASLNVIDLDTSAVTRRVSLPARPEGVAVGYDGRVVITTIGTGQNNAFNTLIIYDPASAAGADIIAVAVPPGTAAPPVAPPSGRPALATRSALLPTNDGRYIMGVNNQANNLRSVFVYEVASGTILRARTVNFVSNVLAIAPDGSRFMAGLTLFDTATLAVLAQQNAANAPFSFPTGNNGNFNTQQNQGGSVFSPDGKTLYSAFNIAPVQNPAPRPNVSRLLLNDPENLLITLGLQLPENLAGKMVIRSDGSNIYALSESGFVVLPAGQIYDNPVAMPEASVVLLSNDQCGVTERTRTADVPVRNTGRGRITASAQLLQLPSAATPGLGGAGGPGGGPIVIILPPVLPGAAAAPAGQNTQVMQTAPQVTTQITPTGANFNFRFSAIAARAIGTVPPHNFLIQSNEAINIPGNVKVFQNSRDTEARADLMPIPVNAADNEGLFDMLIDNVRQRLYIANAGLNRVEVFDTRTRRFLAPIRVGQLPHSMAFGTDGVTLYVANSGGETISIVDLDRMQQTRYVKLPPLPYNANVALATPSLIAMGQRGAHVVVSSGANNSTLWRIVGDQAVPRTLNQAVFGANARTLAGPTQTMVSTPNGEFTLLLAGNGNGYLYDASIDEWVVGRQLFGPPNQTSLAPNNGYYGPVAAGPRGQYFLANGLILNTSLTPTGILPGAGSTGPVTGLPDPRGLVVGNNRPVAAVASAGNNTFVRFTQPVLTNANQILNPNAGTAAQQQQQIAALQAAGLSSDSAMVELVDVNTGAAMRTAPALEGPLARVVGNGTQRVNGRTMAVDASGATVYVLTTSGLSVVPLNPVAPADRPLLNPNGVVNTANYLPSTAPGGLISIFGRNLGSGGAASSATWPTRMGGVCVTLNNQPLPLALTSETQINAQIPPELPAGRYPLIIRSLDRLAASQITQLTVSRSAPAVFVNENGYAAIYHADGRPVTKEHPAKRDEQLVLFATGLGATRGGRVTAGAPAPSSPLAVTERVQVYFGDIRYREAEVIVDWSGLLPGSVGVNQISLRVPGAHIRGETLPVTLRISGVTSPTTGPAPPRVAVD